MRVAGQRKLDRRVRVTFPLREGSSPFSVERLWAERTAHRSQVRLMNTPFYAYGVSFLDIVEVSRQGMELVVERLVEESGHSTVRVMAEDSSMLSDMKRELEAAGCSWEVSHMDNYIAVDIPPHVDYLRLRLALDRLVREGEVEFEESALSSVHRRSDQ